MSTEQEAGRSAPAGLPCPVCKVNLLMTSREGVEIDFCPNCRGVWLDRGELDKIIERSVGSPAGSSAYDQVEQPATRYDRDADPRYQGGGFGGHGGSHGGHGGGHGGHGGSHGSSHGNRDGHGRGHGGRGSFLSRLFD